MPLLNSLLASQYDLLAAPEQTLAEGRLMARALAESVADETERLAVARDFCTKTVATYWPATAGNPALRPTPINAGCSDTLTGASSTLAAELGDAAAQLTPELAFYEIGRLYNTMMPRSFRAHFGVYYTPPDLVEHLLDQATAAGVDWSACRVLDPACGGGAFLAPIVRRMLVGLGGAGSGGCEPAVILSNLAVRLQGFEIDPFAAWLSRVAVDAVLAKVAHTAGRPLPDCVQVCDALTKPDPEPERKASYDLVIGNPPYGRIGLDATQRTRFRRSLYGHANLYGIFTDLALRYTRADGIVAYVTPTSFLAGNYFKQLRELIGKEAPPVSMDFVETRKGIFDDVLQETLLTVYRKDGVRRVATAATVSPSTDGSELRHSPAGSFELPANASEPWLVPRTKTQAKLLKTASTFTNRLGDWGYAVSTGPLVWNRQKQQLMKHRCANCLPLLWAEAVTTDGRFAFRANKRNHQPWFQIRDERDTWLVVTEPCVLVQRTTAKEQARRLIAAQLPRSFLADHGGAVVENHLNMIRSNGKPPIVSATTLSAFLNSCAVDTVFRCISGSVAVSAYELEALPLPPPATLATLDTLIKTGTDAAEIEVECARLYGMYNP